MGIHSMPRITLIGYRGTGKTTVAERLARRLSCSWSDADAVLEEKIGCSIAALVRDRGEPAFRDEESLVLEQLLSGFPGVLATGGGVVLRPANRAALRGCGRPVVWLTASADVVRGRLALDPTTASRRPGLTGGDPLAEVGARGAGASLPGMRRPGRRCRIATARRHRRPHRPLARHGMARGGG
jgi:shikimate kinase